MTPQFRWTLTTIHIRKHWRQGLLLAAVLLTPACEVHQPTSHASRAMVNVDALPAVTQQVAEAAPQRPGPTAFLWSIQSQTNTLYILGSVHLLKPSDYPLAASIEAAYTDAENLIFELNLDDAQSPSNVQVVFQTATFSNGETLQSSLAPDLYALAEQQAGNIGLPIAGFDRFKPWFLAITLPVLKLQRLGYDPNYGVDQYLFNRATQDNKGIVALETVADQLNIFDRLDISEQAKFLHQTLKEMDALEGDVSELVSAWKSGNTQALEEQIFANARTEPVLRAKLFDDRNQKWVEILLPLLEKDEDYLLVVGAGHLVGKNNVIQLLRDRGYRAEQR